MMGLSRASYVLAIWLALLASINFKNGQDSNSSTSADAYGVQAEPPFPKMTRWNQPTVKITSEIIDESDVGSQTQEEYLDLARGKAAYVTTSKLGYHVKYLDAQEGLSFTYRPYKCRVERISDLPSDVIIKDTDGLVPGASNSNVWNYNVKTGFVSSKLATSMTGGREEAKEEAEAGFRLFGVTGLWMLATQRSKTFSRAQIIYSASSELYRESLLWTVGDEENKLTIKLYFMEPIRGNQRKSNDSGDDAETPEDLQPTLEMIQIESRPDGRLLRTINILSVDYSIPREVYEELMSPPLGHGCFSALSDVWADEQSNLADEVRERRAYSSRYDADDGAQVWNGYAELEITATKFEAPSDSSQALRTARSSDTFSVELARAQVRIPADKDSSSSYVKLIRWRNTLEDKKVILKHNIKVKYAIDMRRGSCEMSHMQPVATNLSSDDESAFDRVPLQFRNGAQFDLNVDLFKEAEDLHFIKSSAATMRRREKHYYEGTVSTKELVTWLKSSTSSGSDPNAIKRTRVIRTYTVLRPNQGDIESLEHSLELSSVTIWLLDEQEANIRESYQIYVISAQTEESSSSNLVEKAKLFDLSQECYLENEAMVQGRDYAWFELTYPASSRLLNIVAANSLQMRQTFYSRFVSDFTLCPKVELLLEEDKFKIRALVLDLPSIELIYDKFPQVEFTPDLDKGDLSYMTPDLVHCSYQCKVHHCTVMSYRDGTKTCALSSRPLYDFSQEGSEPIELKDNFVFRGRAETSNTFKVPAQLEKGQIYKKRLASVIASLQHQNYEPPADFPQIPDEVSLPTSESGLTREEWAQAVRDFIDKLRNFLEKDGRLPSLAFVLELGGHVFALLPNMFELESDPLEEFGLHKDLLDDEDNLPGQDQSVPHFHAGLAMSRFNPACLGNPKNDKTAQASGVTFNSMRGLSYDQCALACWDSKCGTFSYCEQGRECIMSNVNTTSRATALNLVETDAECFIAQRDFLGQFVKFPNVFRPQVYKSLSSSDVMDPSECALNCVASTDYRCLSFEFCRSSDNTKHGQCFYQTERYLTAEPEAPTKSTGCDHYSRSQLADFIRLDARRVTKSVLDQLKSNIFDGLSVFSCAEKCANDLPDCTGFQFCHQNFGSGNLRPERECTTIESKVTPSMLKPLGGNTSETVVDEQAGGEIVKSGDYLTYDIDCQVFSMRRDSSEAHLRDLAFGGLVRSSSDKLVTDQSSKESSGLTIWGGIFLYLVVMVITAVIACGLLLLKDNKELFRQRIERLKLVMGI